MTERQEGSFISPRSKFYPTTGGCVSAAADSSTEVVPLGWSSSQGHHQPFRTSVVALLTTDYLPKTIPAAQGVGVPKKRKYMATAESSAGNPSNGKVIVGGPPAPRVRKKQNSNGDDGDYRVVLQEDLISSTSQARYSVLQFLGRGTFGQVVKCWKKGTNDIVAVKILKDHPNYERQGRIELGILGALKRENADEFNFVRSFEHFQHRNHTCLVFEMLEQNLFDFMRQDGFKPLPLMYIRPIIQQVLTALWKLKQLRIIHADLKPENIMLVNHSLQPFRVKVIDFGSACYATNAVSAAYLQSRYYRAPEMILGLPFTHTIDMWSLGCIMAELFLGCPLYPGASEYDQIRFITETQGLPTENMLCFGSKTQKYFVRDVLGSTRYPRWRLKTPEEIHIGHRVKSQESRKFKFSCLDEIVSEVERHILVNVELLAERADRGAFIMLLKRMLAMETGDRRISPEDALNHPFITMKHLDEYRQTGYLQSCMKPMKICNRGARISEYVFPGSIPLHPLGSAPGLNAPLTLQNSNVPFYGDSSSGFGAATRNDCLHAAGGSTTSVIRPVPLKPTPQAQYATSTDLVPVAQAQSAWTEPHQIAAIPPYVPNNGLHYPPGKDSDSNSNGLIRKSVLMGPGFTSNIPSAANFQGEQRPTRFSDCLWSHLGSSSSLLSLPFLLAFPQSHHYAPGKPPPSHQPALGYHNLSYEGVPSTPDLSNPIPAHSGNNTSGGHYHIMDDSHKSLVGEGTTLTNLQPAHSSSKLYNSYHHPLKPPGLEISNNYMAPSSRELICPAMGFISAPTEIDNLGQSIGGAVMSPVVHNPWVTFENDTDEPHLQPRVTQLVQGTEPTQPSTSSYARNWYVTDQSSNFHQANSPTFLRSSNVIHPPATSFHDAATHAAPGVYPYPLSYFSSHT